MSTPNFDKGQGEPTGQPGYGGPADPFAPSAGTPDPYGPPAGAPGYGTPGSYGTPGGYGAPAGYGSPAPYGTAPYGSSGVVGPGGEWLGPPLASWGRRVGSTLVDGIITGVIVTVLAQVSPSLVNDANLLVILVLGYLVGTTGQSPGKQLLGVKVVRVDDGQVSGVGSGIARQFLHILDALPLLLGYLWPIWDKKNQTFTDKILKTVSLRV